jgi:hypothetical protein
MSEKDTGGYAFPLPATPREHYTESEPGMTLRDYFAAKALEGHCAHSGVGAAAGTKGHVTTNCYALADAMLKAREA